MWKWVQVLWLVVPLMPKPHGAAFSSECGVLSQRACGSSDVYTLGGVIW